MKLQLAMKNLQTLETNVGALEVPTGPGDSVRFEVQQCSDSGSPTKIYASTITAPSQSPPRRRVGQRYRLNNFKYMLVVFEDGEHVALLDYNTKACFQEPTKVKNYRDFTEKEWEQIAGSNPFVLCGGE